jgi:4-amino-4-deoxy-L-arabinose transferase-like glycosyltransferase
MEATALGRGSLAQLLDAIREAVQARSRLFWIVAAITALGASLRLASLGLQSYHHDEIVTAGRVLRGSLWHAVEKVGDSESSPPLYYLLAWLWTQVFGTAEVGLRSLSAAAGIAVVPVGFLIGAEAGGRRTGIAASALLAVNPMLLWYSQEARCYSLLVLLTSVALLFFLRALRSGSGRDMVWWALASALALATHYFAFFPVGAEAAWLLWRHRRDAGRALGWVAVVAVLLAPLALWQMSQVDHTDWIERFGMTYRIGQTAVAFMVGETGDLIAEPVRPLLALAPGLLTAAAFALLLLRGDPRERRSGGLLAALAAATLVAPLLLAAAGKDFVIDRNLLPALVPLLLIAALGITAARAGRLGAAVGAALVAYSLGFSVWTNFDPSLQRPDWRAVAAGLGEPAGPRAMVTWMLGAGVLRHYLAAGAFQVVPEGERWFVGEVDLISNGPAPPGRPPGLGPSFRRAGGRTVGRFQITRYESPRLARVSVRELENAPVGFRNARVLMDGIGPAE